MSEFGADLWTGCKSIQQSSTSWK